MAASKNKPVEQVTQSTTKVADKVVKEPMFYIYELREHSQELFKVKPEVLDGALYGYKNIQITKSETKKLLEAFLKKEVK